MEVSKRHLFIKIVKHIGIAILAGIVAVMILSVMCCFYYVLPIHIENIESNTDYVWTANARWIKLTEGISTGQFDAKGYNNSRVIENPDIIILGSSHMEATNVMPDKNVGYLLSEKFDGFYTVYNMGISGHDFFKVCQYLPQNLEIYEPKIVVIETSTVGIFEDNVSQVVHGTVEHTASHSSGLMGTLQKVPFLRLLYQQVKGGLIDLFISGGNTSATFTEGKAVQDIDTSLEVEQESYDELFDYLASWEEKYNTEIIIFYHPTETIMEDGTIKFEDSEFRTTFATTAEKYGITFVDMTDSFENMFYEEHHVAHGFATGELGTGHLNEYGHAAVADSLYDVIMELEGNYKPCK